MKHLLTLVLVAVLTGPILADLPDALSKVSAPPAIPSGAHVSLPLKHECQKQLRTCMAGLKEADFRPDYKDFAVVPLTGDADEKFRVWILSQGPFAVGLKRNYSSLIVHPALFTVPVIEGQTAILRPLAHPEPLVEIADWNYAGNPYHNARLSRFGGAVEVTFDRPRRVTLSPAEWVESYMMSCACRNILIDMLETDGKAAAIKEARTVTYQIGPAVR